MNNLEIYEKAREVPKEAQKTITGGRLNGFTDINPMWRIKKLTELFGPCGVGWYTEVLKQWHEASTDGRVAAFCNINLYVKIDGEWSKPIFGTGGSMFVDIEKSNPRASDECFKMAYTDALSVACKSLGIGADVYWGKDKTKYDGKSNSDESVENTDKTDDVLCPKCQSVIKPFKYNGCIKQPNEILGALGMCYSCYKKEKAVNRKNENN